jgi:hypothetical protein
MLRSSERVRCRVSRATSSEAEPHVRGWIPRARWELARGGVKPLSEVGTRLRGHQALERGGGFVVQHPTLERGGASLEGRRGPTVCGAAEAFLAVGLSLPRAAVVRGVIRSLWICLFIFIVFGEG